MEKKRFAFTKIFFIFSVCIFAIILFIIVYAKIQISEKLCYDESGFIFDNVAFHGLEVSAQRILTVKFRADFFYTPKVKKYKKKEYIFYWHLIANKNKKITFARYNKSINGPYQIEKSTFGSEILKEKIMNRLDKDL